MAEQPFIIRAIDVGYGDTKFVKRSEGGRIECGVFPSLAFPAHAAKPVVRCAASPAVQGGEG